MKKISLFFPILTLSLFVSYGTYASHKGPIIMQMNDEQSDFNGLRYRRIQKIPTVTSASYQPSDDELSEEKFYIAMRNFKNHNYRTAFKLFKQAAELGSAKAKFNLGIMREFGRGKPKSSEKAVEWYTKAIQGGYEHEDAHKNLARALKSINK